MQVKQFLEIIKQQNNLPLLFEYKPGSVVSGGYHVTEIKNAEFQTIDCGNSLHSWKEVIIQIWVPDEANPEDGWMPTSKFAKIWDIVDARLNLYQDAEVRIEFGDASNLTSNYHVDGLQVSEDGLVVQMAPPRTMCKPREILVPFAENAGAMVGEQGRERVETIMPLTMSNASACCSPEPAVQNSCCG